jgi:phosphatidate phosphatase PAH1
MTLKEFFIAITAFCIGMGLVSSYHMISNPESMSWGSLEELRNSQIETSTFYIGYGPGITEYSSPWQQQTIRGDTIKRSCINVDTKENYIRLNNMIVDAIFQYRTQNND